MDSKTQYPLAASVLVLRKDQKVLAVSRRKDLNSFGLPGGKVDPGESPLQAARREMREETGVTPIDHFQIFCGICHGDVAYFNINFMATTFVGDPKQMGEGRVAWIPYRLLYFGPFATYNRALLKHIQFDCNPNPMPVVQSSIERLLKKLLDEVEDCEDCK